MYFTYMAPRKKKKKALFPQVGWGAAMYVMYIRDRVLVSNYWNGPIHSAGPVPPPLLPTYVCTTFSKASGFLLLGTEGRNLRRPVVGIAGTVLITYTRSSGLAPSNNLWQPSAADGADPERFW